MFRPQGLQVQVLYTLFNCDDYADDYADADADADADA